jgi:hypothetical protein
MKKKALKGFIVGVALLAFGIGLAGSAQAEEEKIKIPKWIQNTKFSGDFRLRYQPQENQDYEEQSLERSRWRIRLRLGAVTKINDMWEVGLGVATGGSDPRSTNWTLNEFESIDMKFDYAYAKFTPAKWVSIEGGQIKRPIFIARDLMWDTDIRPDGFAAKMKWGVAPNTKLFVTPAVFILDEKRERESGTQEMPIMGVLQAGVDWKFMGKHRLQVAGSGYLNSNIEGWSSGNSGGYNTLDEDGNLIYDYNAFALDADVRFMDVLSAIPFIRLFGQYVVSDADSKNTGWLGGFRFGHPTIWERWKWQIRYNYRSLERDAWLDFLPDSDFFDGRTNGKGHEIQAHVGLAKNVTIGIDYYDTEAIDTPEPGELYKQKILQADLVLRW